MPGRRVEAGAAIGEGADPRQHDALGRRHRRRIGGDRRHRAPAAASALAAERRLPEP